jgi:acetyltransferase-like isoleucine patch superfamily enzyme
MILNYIDTSAKLGENVKIGHFSVIEQDVTLGNSVAVGNNTTICAGTIIGDNVQIGDGSVIGKQPKPSKTSTVTYDDILPPLLLQDGVIVGANAVIYAGTEIGVNTVIADQAFVREKCHIGDYVIIGRGVTVENSTTIGAYTKIQSGSYITAHMTIEDHVFIAPMVQTTNDNFMGRTEERFAFIKGPTIKRGARIGGGTVLCPGVMIEEETFVAAGAVVTKDTETKSVVKGVPAKIFKMVPDNELLENQ